jgi:hypothetical protein
MMAFTQQSNPVLFVLMGESAVLAPELNRLLDSYHLKAADCVMVPDTDVTHLRAEINRIQQDFLHHRYTTVGLARVGYILHDATYLPDLRNHVENILSPLYPSGIITDIYWLTDETSTLESDNTARAGSMNVLANGLPEAQVYLLSNLNSDSRHTPWTDVMQTIALLTLFKDGEPREYAAPPDASRYNEFMFLQNTERGKPFLTAGSKRLQIPQKALRALLLTALLSPLPLASPAAPLLALPKAAPWQPEEEYIYGLALPAEEGKIIDNNMTRRTIISRLFGSRLDKILNMHPPRVDDSEKDDIEQSLSSFGLFEALAITGENGAWPLTLQNALSGNETAIATAEKSLQQWLDTPQRLNELKTDRRQFSFYHSTANYPYTIAAEYIKRMAAIHAFRQYGEKLTELLEFVQDLHGNLIIRRAAVEDVRATYEVEAEALNVVGSPLAQTNDYFLGLFAQHARANASALRALTLPYRQEIPMTELGEYIEKKLLKDPIFSRSFTEMLTYVADDKSLTEWATDSRYTHIRLRFGSAVLYNEANLHMPADWAAQVKYGYESQGLGRANLFTDSTANRVSVLYHAGAFGPGDLYYADLYK